VEGETEEDFVNEVLRDHLASKGVLVTANHLGLSKGSQGIVGWQNAAKYICNTLKEDPEVVVTTLVDLYALKKDWPGLDSATKASYDRRSAIMTEAIKNDLEIRIGKNLNPNRCLPFVLVHEFETLLFADPANAASAVGIPELEAPMAAIASSVGSPEEINDSPITAPSKRLLKIFKEGRFGRYDKRVHGNVAALGIGLPTIRKACPQFGNWLTSLEKLGERNTSSDS
jgi:hypothetical protein